MKQSEFKFANPIISKINYIVHPDFNNTDKVLNISQKFETNISQDPEDSKAIVELNIAIGNMDAEKEPFFIEMTIGAMFKWPDNYTDELVKDLLSINAPSLLLGYARPMIASITNMSPYPAYNLPFYNFTE